MNIIEYMIVAFLVVILVGAAVVMITDYNDHTKIIAKLNATVQRSEKETEKLKQFITIDQTDDIEFLRNEVKYLWKILDDIDTCTDMAKSNDKWYRQQVEKLVQKRFQNIETDGYEIYRRECN